MVKTIIFSRVHNGNGISEDGFTLIEVLVAIAIFAIGLLGISSMQIRATHGTTTAGSNTELTAFAADQMERLTRLPFNDPDLAETGPSVPPHQDNLNDPRFSASWEVADDVIFTGTKTVTLTAVGERRGNNGTLIFQYVIPSR
jgi:type IV pilus assembly protein PilV